MRMPGIGRSTLLALLFASATGLVALAAQKDTENVDKTVAFPQNGTLKLRNFSGDVHITGTSGREVVVKAVRRAGRDQLDHIKLDIQTSGSTVTIEANKRDADWDHHDNNVVETTFDIQIPASATLDLYGFSSDIDVRGVTGDQKVQTFSGGITIVGAKGAVNAEAFSGAIDVDATAAGASPDLTAKTFSGKIRARLSDNAKGNVEFNSFNGSFDSDLPMTLQSAGRRNTRGTLPGGSGRTLSFHTFSGSLKIAK